MSTPTIQVTDATFVRDDGSVFLSEGTLNYRYKLPLASARVVLDVMSADRAMVTFGGYKSVTCRFVGPRDKILEIAGKAEV